MPVILQYYTYPGPTEKVSRDTTLKQLLADYLEAWYEHWELTPIQVVRVVQVFNHPNTKFKVDVNYSYGLKRGKPPYTEKHTNNITLLGEIS